MTVEYRVTLAPAAQRQARRLQPAQARRVRSALRTLVDNPHPAGSVKLSGHTAIWRIRTGHIRIIYEVDGGERNVLVIRIAQRDEKTYRGL